MEPFTCFMDVENSRSYIDELYSEENCKCQEAIVCLKNAVIGSNKKKGSIISQGIVPRLIGLLCNANKPLQLRIDAGIVLGSLAKGTESQVHSLMRFNTVEVLIAIVFDPCTDERLMETCLGALQTIVQYPFAPLDLIHSDINNIKRLIQIAAPKSSFSCQAYVVNIFVPLCHSSHQQKNLCQAEVIPFLARLMISDNTTLQVPALKCLAAMCFTNKSVSNVVHSTYHAERSILDILTALLSRTRDVQVQLSASRCLTYLHRSGALPAEDYRIVYKTLPCLARLCSDEFDEDTRATAAETLAYLAEIDSELQRLAAISNHLIASLANLVKCPSVLSRQGAFRCFASLAANDEEIRKRIIEMEGLMEEVLSGLKDCCPEVRLSAVRCLHSLSRSVQLLRTTFQDHSVWRPLMNLLVGDPSLELQTVVTSTICNLLLEFSPAKEPMLESGAVEMLCELTKHVDPALRLNGSWALMNMAFQAEQHVKTKIINKLGMDRIFQLLGDRDERVIMKTLGLLRNLLSKTLHIETIMSEHSSEVLRAVSLVLDDPHPPEVKEQALIIISNITAGAREKDYVLQDEKIVKKIRDFLVANDNKLQMGAVFVVRNLLDKSSRRQILRKWGFLDNLEQLLRMTPRDSQFYEDIRHEILRFDYSEDH
ncbi:armadillo repeat-containing protein 8-like [Anopheles ziemanni]|uniref:armadillo repeat-containing protein 8-like n=1 Tax=Anopheles ziemanni TaxID=345580 RepID=UPI00265A5DE1|nr:armadillo repeat-containing protein 8-like isoform X2 [Anopheles coustani]XP_058168736.1 armadillo repeat-containing protein 8-like [Anopheles ziemanni]